MKNSIKSLKDEAKKEMAKRELERRHKKERDDLVDYIAYHFEENNLLYQRNWHHELIADKLNDVLEGKCTRLIINIPPGHMKTELITKCFPVWALGKNPKLDICATGYSTTLTQTYSGEARDYYLSDSFKNVFPRRPNIRSDQNTKEWWKNEEGGSYYATGTGGSITGKRFNIFIIDDPLKPDDADSDVKRVGINNWYDNTVLSRLYDPLKDAVIIIMQRTHENDLCGYLIERMKEGTGEDFEVISLPAFAEREDEYRKEGEALHKDRYPKEALDTLKKSLGKVNFSCQYQQNPIAKESQEFHEEWFRYYTEYPKSPHIFTTVDPAFSKSDKADYTAIVTVMFKGDSLYVLEVTNARIDPAEMEDKILYHARKWKPRKIGVEAVAAQSMIGFSLRNRLRKEGLLIDVEEIRQKGTKEEKIRRLIPLYRNGQIYHKAGVCDKLEEQLIKFPRGSHDDIPDALQMAYELYKLTPNTPSLENDFEIKYAHDGRPIIIKK